jgi:hypothetical protein
MILKSCTRIKEGKTHTDYSVCESLKTPDVVENEWPQLNG